MNSNIKLLNPDGKLLASVEQSLRLARKTKPIWAKRLDRDQTIETIEGPIQAKAGNYLCRGVVGEFWAQAESKLREKYSPCDEMDAEGWQRFDPQPDAPPVEATEVDEPFQVDSHFGRLNGNAGDYVVRSTTDRSDVWIVAKSIFEASYVIEPASGTQPRLNKELWLKVIAEEDARDAQLREQNQGKPMVISQVESFELLDLLDEKEADKKEDDLP